MTLSDIVTATDDRNQIPTSNERIPDPRIHAELTRMWRAGVGFSSTGNRDRFIELFKRGVAA